MAEAACTMVCYAVTADEKSEAMCLTFSERPTAIHGESVVFG